MTVLSFDELVLGMIAQGVPKERAEASARRELGLVHSPGHAVKPLDDDALEDDHVSEGKNLSRALGGRVYSSLQKRRAKVTPGQPDTKIFFRKHRRAVWWEAKAEWGRQSTAQKEFQEEAEACHEDYVCGPLTVFEAWLLSNHIGRKEPDGTWTPLPFHPLIEDRT